MQQKRSFKEGERVVRTFTGPMYKAGDRATIIEQRGVNADDYLVVLDENTVLQWVYWNSNCFELEEIYDSPLYQAML
jgi:hypothetical protein